MTDRAQIEREARAAVAAKQTVNDSCSYPFCTPEAWYFQRYYQLAALARITELENQLKLRCTCPSGDGSLRCPCPAHPAKQEENKHA